MKTDALAENQDIAQRLREMADLLQAQGANPFRAGAYRKGADTLAELDGGVREIFDAGGPAGLEALPHIGPSIGSAIAQMLITGQWTQLERLRGTIDAASLFTSIPGVGPELAEAIHEALGVDTLEALEIACHDGRLADVPGVGPRRAAAIRNSVTAMLNKPRRRAHDATGTPEEPAVGLLLRVDADYRGRAEAGKLELIAPRRFNPGGEKWLPILHETYEGWHFTALYSNTANAHKLGRVFDWVVIYFHHDSQPEHQRTVVTETKGPLRGERVVRGRERECDDFYALRSQG
ncbi:MAG TPA: helix-hairpin-helix domain-containing protein [Burkholderiaceae bacterium]